VDNVISAKDCKTVFIVFPPYQEIHNVLYTKELFIKKFLNEGYLVVAIACGYEDTSNIQEEASNYRLVRIDNLGFVSLILFWVRYILACKGIPRLPFYMRLRWEGVFKNSRLKTKLLKSILFMISILLKEDIIFYIYRKISSVLPISKLYQVHKPFLTILPFYLSSLQETEIIAVARNNNSTTVAIPARISTCDDVFYYAKPDLLLAWNELMKKQLISWHGCNKNSVMPIGILKCDYYKRKDYISQTQGEFKRINGLFNDSKIISIICGNISCFRAYEIASSLFNSRQIKFKFQILLRANPDRFEEQLKSLNNKDGLPVFLLRGFSSDINKYAIREQIISCANFLKNSDIIISVASTMCLESLYFNIPQIYLIFEEFKHYYNYDYIQPLLNEPGIKFVHDDTELIDAVNRYLENPLLENRQREELFRKYCYSIDGNALGSCFNEIAKIKTVCRLQKYGTRNLYH
jgi:hypothetical protein